MRWFYLMMISILLVGCTSQQASDNANPPGDGIWDRVAVKDGAELYDNPELNVDKSGPRVPRWTMAKFVKSSGKSSELVRLASGKEFWVYALDFYPVYRVESREDVELCRYYLLDDQRDSKGGRKPGEMKVIAHLKPGSLVAVDAIGSAPGDMFSVITKDGKTGFLSKKALKPVGDKGWR